MISRRVEFALEQLRPRIDEHDLALSHVTAAAVYALTARDVVTEVELTAVQPLSWQQTDRLGAQLAQDLDQLRHLLATLDPDGHHASQVELAVGDDYVGAAVATADGRDLLAVSVSTNDPAVQPLDVVNKATSYGSMRVPTMHQLAVAGQSLHRWLAEPHNTHNTVEVGLAAARIGADYLWAERTSLAVPRKLAKLVAITGSEGRSRLASPMVPPTLADRAQAGLDQLHRHLAAQLRDEQVRR